jgi:hypothetical protein
MLDTIEQITNSKTVHKLLWGLFFITALIGGVLKLTNVVNSEWFLCVLVIPAGVVTLSPFVMMALATVWALLELTGAITIKADEEVVQNRLNQRCKELTTGAQRVEVTDTMVSIMEASIRKELIEERRRNNGFLVHGVLVLILIIAGIRLLMESPGWLKYWLQMGFCIVVCLFLGLAFFANVIDGILSLYRTSPHGNKSKAGSKAAIPVLPATVGEKSTPSQERARHGKKAPPEGTYVQTAEGYLPVEEADKQGKHYWLPGEKSAEPAALTEPRVSPGKKCAKSQSSTASIKTREQSTLKKKAAELAPALSKLPEDQRAAFLKKKGIATEYLAPFLEAAKVFMVAPSSHPNLLV